MDTSEPPRVLVPGDVITGCAENHVSGEGTYVRASSICSALFGHLQVTEDEPGKKKFSVIHHGLKRTVVPQVEKLVTVRVTAVNPRFAKADIICVEDRPVDQIFHGQIRFPPFVPLVNQGLDLSTLQFCHSIQDVRSSEQDRIEMYQCFRPGDIVIARVISLGDAKSYYLSTAENDLGVIYAKSIAGAPLIPLSWNEMRCEATGAKEPRKCARVV
eukprot:m.147102 g.147102  ORF g.147102 m.147102 type:complete len:215 (-) comp52724_c0_seq4:54-698(-)